MPMTIEILKVKSEENFETAKLAEKRQYFDVAVSRYYYCAYQKILYISKKRGFYVEPNKTENAHVVTINAFVRNLDAKLASNEKVELLKMKELRRQRNDSDYKEIKKDSKDFNLSFKFHFNGIINIINKLM